MSGVVLKTGRPSRRTDEVVQRVIDGLSAGIPLTVICKPDDMPGERTVRDWMASDSELSAAIARAREIGFDVIASDALDIIDAEPERYATELGERVDGGSVQWAKNRAELRLKLLAKWDPKRYGDKLEVDNTSSDGSMSPREPRYNLVKPD